MELFLEVLRLDTSRLLSLFISRVQHTSAQYIYKLSFLIF